MTISETLYRELERLEMQIGPLAVKGLRRIIEINLATAYYEGRRSLGTEVESWMLEKEHDTVKP